MAKIGVLGAGMMGSAACVPLADRGHDVRLIGTPLDGQIVAALKSTGAHPKLGAPLPPSVRCFGAPELEQGLLDVDAIVLGVSSSGVSWAASALAERLSRQPLPLAFLSKGLELGADGVRLLDEVFVSGLVKELVIAPVSIAGPCIAGELARRVPTLAVFSGRDRAVAERFAEWFTTPYYGPRVFDDHRGAQLCAALKNAYALGVGFAAGIHERRGGMRGSVAMHNHEAAVFAQATREMCKLVSALGGQIETVLGLAGVGDLNVTCNGGRTGRFGALLGFGHALPEAIRLMQGATLECLEILAVCERLLGAEWPGYPALAELPLLAHLIDVALHGAPVNVPFQDFFRA